MAMVCKASERQRNGSWRALILSDETPAEMPVTGVGVAGIPDDVALDGGSVLLDLEAGTKHILGNDGQTWHEWA